jgi:isoleucyl-tRNA synthetase
VLTLVPAAIGPRLGPDTQRVIAAVKRGEWQQVDEGVEVDGIVLQAQDGEYELRLRPRDERNGRALPTDAGVVILDTELDEELESEGLARDVVRQVQAARREAGLAITDHITLQIAAPADVARALQTHRAYVAEQTLAVNIGVTEGDSLSIEVTKTLR